LKRYLFLLALLSFHSLFALSYSARIVGVPFSNLKQQMEKASQVISAPEKQIPTLNILRLKVKNDIERITNVAVYFGYFNCRVESTLTTDETPKVLFSVTLGEQFSLGKLTLLWSDEILVQEDVKKRGKSDLIPIGPQEEDIASFQTGEPALGRRIVAMDRELIRSLKSRAFAFCKIIAKKITADQVTHTVDIAIEVQTGPMIRFGPTKVVGPTRVRPELFKSYQLWKEGQLYSPIPIEQTETALQKSGLFHTIQIEESANLGDNWSLPITIRVADGKPRTIGAGISYMTTYGGGVSAQWEHRNLRGLGRKLSLQASIWQKRRSATLSYTIPNFRRRKQDLLWVLEYDAQNYLPFTSSAVKASVLLNRPITRRSSILFGPSFERLESKRILSHKLYHLTKFPVQFRWSNANSPLDPTSGLSLNIRLIPAWQSLTPKFSYLIHNSSISGYTSFSEDTVTLALRLGIANVLGADKDDIPLPDRLFGGSENALRGYRTGSVSPLNEENKPIGGRSMLTASFDLRIRPREQLGWVVFYDVGNVYTSQLHRLDNPSLLHSVGIGARYTTPIGPLRFDIAFPLQRRKDIDPPFQLYFSIGQAF